MATKKGASQSKPPTNLSMLTEEEKKALYEEARASVLAEMEQDARDVYFQQALKEVRRGHSPKDQIVEVMIDIASFLPYIAIDGIQYFHGYTYPVERNRAVVLYEQMQRSWQHQDEIDGRSRFNPYRRPQNAVIGPRHAAQPTRGANGVVVLTDDTGGSVSA